MLNHLLIGSRLLQGVYGVRQPTSKSDSDVICTPCKFEVLKRHLLNQGYQIFKGNHPVRKSYYFKHSTEHPVEIEVAEEGSVADKLLSIASKHSVSNIDLAYTLKMSHRFLRNSPHFEKTRNDILDLRKIGARIPECLVDWFKEREDETYYYKHPNLNQKKEDFFDTPNVTYIYDHDTIHEAVAIEDKPAYTNFLVGEVKTCKNKFNSLHLNIRLNAVLEESSVLSIERSLVYRDNVTEKDIQDVWLYSLQKVCTSITSGWFRDFAWEKYDLCKKLYYSRMLGYYDKFLQGVKDGRVKNV
jgi:hypothetical protein